MPSPITFELQPPEQLDFTIEADPQLSFELPGYAIAKIPSNYGLITWNGSVLTVS